MPNLIPDYLPNNDGYFGWCPDCFEAGIHRVSIGAVLTTCLGNHYMTCQLHKTKWPLGYNLFSAWREMPHDDLNESEQILNQFKEVEPID